MTWKILLKDKILREKKVSIKEVDGVLAKARKSLKASEILTNNGIEESVFKEAYDAMILASRALMFALGVRPRTVGSHFTTIMFCELYFGKEYKLLVEKFRKMKRKRNYLIYGIGMMISKTEAENSIRTAKEFIKTIEAEVSAIRKQKKLI